MIRAGIGHEYDRLLVVLGQYGHDSLCDMYIKHYYVRYMGIEKAA